ncbi:MAG: amidohydrolase [Oscillibacter sp.]|jgi:aminobenzoyl-glutamate utilization protein B|nr:amidohydrolase [Oscillibacter sp.]
MMSKQEMLSAMDQMDPEVLAVSRELWNHPETSGEEQYSADFLRSVLRKNGFAVTDVPGMPHAFRAEYGTGAPVIGILGEYDALPGLSQDASATRHQPLREGAPGHGCGHNLLGGASLGAALGLKYMLEHGGVSGTVRFYGCPGEETLDGKTHMVAAHAFDGCDAALSWHPMTSNTPYTGAYLANASVRFYFKGKTAHASFSPHLGRSALDAVELMSVGANYLREHVIDKARIHYTTDSGGFTPNIVPDRAESWYYVRAPRISDVYGILDRLKDVARGAALMTGTTVEFKTVSGCCEMLPNRVMEKITRNNMETIPTPVYTEAEERFAAELLKNIPPEQLARERETYGCDADSAPAIFRGVSDYETARRAELPGSSDSGDVSYNMPMSLFTAACAPLGATSHTWIITACAGSGIGEKGMLYAARVLAGTGYDLLTDGASLKAAQEEFRKVSATHPYTPIQAD